MDVRKLALLIGALLIAGVTAIMAKNMFSGASAPQASAQVGVPAPATGPEVLVASRNLPVGTILDPASFHYQRWPEGLAQPVYFIRGQGADPQNLVGTVVRTEITAGQPLTQGAIVRPGERGFLAAALGPGMRAITVAVSATSGVAGFIFPGDRVDIVLTQQVDGGGDGPPLRASETIVRNVRILAVDQRMQTRDENGQQTPQAVSSVTLEVTPKIAEKVAVAQTMGQLSLALRSLADNSQELERAIASGEVHVPHNNDPNAERQMLIQIANQPIDANPTYTIGSEVSRFQRSTVPARGSSGGNNNNGGGSAPSAPATAAPSAPAQPVGPVVRIARGNNVTIVPVGAR